MGKIDLDYVDHVVQVRERVRDGDNIHFARAEGNSDDQARTVAKSIPSDFHHCIRDRAAGDNSFLLNREEQRACVLIHGYLATLYY